MSQVNTLPKECVLERIQAMMHQEDSSYRYESYFPPMSKQEFEEAYSLNSSWREKICQWSYNVVDHFDLPREVVAVSLNLFDRYLATRGNQCSGNMALLASLTTLHISIKVHSEKNIKISTLASLSRGQFAASHIEQMEWQIFKALNWKLHPPTLFAVISYMLMLFPSEVHHTVRKELFEVAIYVAELSVCDAFFVKFPASTVALAAIMNVMEDLPLHRLSLRSRDSFWTDVSMHLTGFRARSSQLEAARDRLRAMFGSGTTAGGATSGTASTSSITTSPTSTTEMQVDETASLASSCAGSFQNASTNNFFTQRVATVDNYRYSPSPNGRRSSTSTVIASSPMSCRISS